MQYPEKYARKYGKPNIRKPEEFLAVPTTCFFNISRRVFLIRTTAGRGIEYSEGMTL